MSTFFKPIDTLSGQSQASQYGFTDPFGDSAKMSQNIWGSQSPLQTGPMGVYNQYSDQILGQLSGLSGPLQSSLSDIAKYQAGNATNAVGSNFANQGALFSGAGAQAFGQAFAQPFANAQAQLQQGQLQAGSGALQQLLGLSGNAYGNALTAGSNLMEHTSGLVAPQTYTNPNYALLMQLLGAGSGAASGAASSGITKAIAAGG